MYITSTSRVANPLQEFFQPVTLASVSGAPAGGVANAWAA
jgi:hypothetical protein